MARAFPSDVLVLDTDGFLHARFGRGRTNARVTQARTYRFPAETFTASVVTPRLADEESFTSALKRLRNETGKWEKVSILLPDSWFRVNIVELPSLPDREAEALDVVRWSLKKTLPIPPDDLRVTYTVLSRGGQGAKVLILSALEATLAAIEKAAAAAGLDVILIEPIGLNIWNAIAVREAETTADRLFVYLRDTDFTTAVFRGAQPLFIRSRNLRDGRTAAQEIRLSASYLRDSLAVESFANCYVAGAGADDVRETIATEFQTVVRPLALRDYVEDVPSGVEGLEAELTACTGVFTA